MPPAWRGVLLSAGSATPSPWRECRARYRRNGPSSCVTSTCQRYARLHTTRDVLDAHFPPTRPIALFGSARSGCCPVQRDAAGLRASRASDASSTLDGDLGEGNCPGQRERCRAKGPDRGGRDHSGSWLPVFRACRRAGHELEFVSASNDPAWCRRHDQSVWSRRSRSAPARRLGRTGDRSRRVAVKPKRCVSAQTLSFSRWRGTIRQPRFRYPSCPWCWRASRRSRATSNEKLPAAS